MGSGSYKTVYLAFDNDTGREVAWNVISFAHLSRSERKRIDAEIQIAKSLDHPRILRFVSAWINKEKEEVVFITERVSGGSLRSYICRLDGPLKLKVIKNWCKQILEGVTYLHNQPNPVIHRDLKCDNIFINGNDGKVLIGDLGLSTSLRGSSSTERVATSIVGTPEFMAPELYEEKYGPPVDIYAFGMCLLEMVSRKYPYAECTTPGQIYKKVISSEKPQVLSRVRDDELRHLIEVCLDTNPDNRPTAEELLNDPFWNQTDDGDKLAEIIEEPPPANPTTAARCSSGSPSKRFASVDEVSSAGGVPSTPVPVAVKKSLNAIVYHEEVAERLRRASANEDKPPRSSVEPIIMPPTVHSDLFPHLPSNIVLGPTDDTLILLSSPKSSPVSGDDLDKSDVLTFCRRNKIQKVEKVHLILEINEGKFHNVIFDFNATTDHPQIIAQELRDAGLVWEDVTQDELVMSVARSIMERIAELDGLGDYEEEPAVSSKLLSDPLMRSNSQQPQLDLLTGPPHDDEVVLSAAPPMVVQKTLSYQALDHVSDVAVNTTTNSTSSMYLPLSRENCNHLAATTLSSQALLSLPSNGPPDEAGMFAPPRSGSIANSLDEANAILGVLSASDGKSTASFYNSLVPPLNVPPNKSPTTDDVRTLQTMLTLVLPGDKGRRTSFVPGVYCAFTQDTVRDLQSHNGLEVTGEMDDRTWDILMEQISVRRKKDEEKAQKREEAAKKAKQEQERKLAMQKEESARAMDNMMEKTLSLFGGPPPGLPKKPNAAPAAQPAVSPTGGGGASIDFSTSTPNQPPS